MFCTYNPLYTRQFCQLFDPTVKNSRNNVMKLVDLLMKAVDRRIPKFTQYNIESFSYNTELLTIKKALL